MTTPAELVAQVRDRLPEAPTIVAVSGGADSASTAWAVLQAAPRRRCRLVHVDHGWPDSGRLKDAAAALADHLSRPLEVIPVTMPNGPSAEGGARQVRLEALEALIEDGEWIVTGHHRDDVAETLLGNLVRGAGATGLSSLRPVRPPYVRPVLDVTRAALRRIADSLRLPYLDDPANTDLRHRRAVLRHRVLPGLEAALGPAVSGGLATAASHLARDDDELERLAADVPVQVRDGAVLLPAPLLAILPTAVATRAVRRALRRLRPPYPGTSAEVDAVLATAHDATPRNLIADHRVTREGPYVILTAAAHATSTPPPLPLPLPGDVSFGRHAIAAAVHRTAHGVRPLGRNRGLLDLDVVGRDLTVRAGRTGERIDLRGGGSKLLRDALAERRVPVRLRAAWPVVEARGRIAWLAGIRVAEWARTAPSTRHTLELQWEGDAP